MFKSCLLRLEKICHQNEFQAIILQCEFIPFMPGWLESWLIRKPFIYDFDDAFYLKYRTGRLRKWAPLLKDKFDSVITSASAVTAGNNVLTNYALQYNKNTHFFPTVVDTSKYIPKMEGRSSKTFTVGWIGSPSTAVYLNELVAPLSAIGLEGPVKFIVIGGKAPIIPNVEIIEIKWTEESEIDLLNSFDVGVMPLPNDDWARGKCAFKLIQYMACSVPVIASPVGANLDVVDDRCGLLASTLSQWIRAFRILRDSESMRKNMGKAGRAKIIENYSLHTKIPELVDLIKNIAKL
jgi:glycosyltransferase involved in cell wall biosynthesis